MRMKKEKSMLESTAALYVMYTPCSHILSYDGMVEALKNCNKISR